MSALPVTKINGKIYVGLQRQQLAGVQLVEGTSDLVTNPSWHLAKTVRNLDEGRNFAAQKLESDFGLKVQQVFSLGGAYHSSPGITAETVHTIAVEVEPSSIVSGATPNSGLTWVALEDLVQQRTQVRDGRLLIGALRLAHATGLLQ